MIVDSHVHVVSPDRERYPLGVEDPSAPHAAWVRDMAVEELLELMDGAGIDKTVIVQAVGAYRYDSSYATDSARAPSPPGRQRVLCGSSRGGCRRPVPLLGPSERRAGPSSLRSRRRVALR